MVVIYSPGRCAPGCDVQGFQPRGFRAGNGAELVIAPEYYSIGFFRFGNAGYHIGRIFREKAASLKQHNLGQRPKTKGRPLSPQAVSLPQTAIRTYIIIKKKPHPVLPNGAF
jgi:hypothetical protein